MKKIKVVQKTPYYSWKIGMLAKGCQECVKGNKLVLFVTGVCSKHCFFCPISDQKWMKDDVYANEWKIRTDKDLIEEAKLTEATGAGITGGDPLARLEKTMKYIKLLKNKFGKNFHIHLYTPLELVTSEKLKKLYNAGLDEIRFHPNLDNKKFWDNIRFAKKFNWSVGIEIPAIPGYEKITKVLVDFAARDIDFLNINELEMSDTNSNKLLEKGFVTKNSLSYGVKGSEELALRIMEYAQGKIKNVHYCTCTLKDKVQMSNRIKKRAKNVAKKFDIITSQGTLVRSIIYIDEIKPGFNYRKSIEKINGNKKNRTLIIKKLNSIKNKLMNVYNIDNKNIFIDVLKYRIVINPDDLKRIKSNIKKEGLIPAIIEEYPTHDAFEVEIEML